MNFALPTWLRSRHLLYVLGALALVLIALGLLGSLGYKIPDAMAAEITNGVVVAALLVFFLGRKLRADEAKAKAPAVDAVVEVGSPEAKSEGEGTSRGT